ncbi:globin domain-containing protein [Thermomonospora umbrina]|uniref:nitric oxide dioxygenase n=1 Tax=Thermomonospora umbrina TaxID=111806 RepID=A0A3D9SQJ3_9ACTN|nr:globin domain-containing protein [Thermomonospora umbrina]REE98048.1 NAD(P)H-flavin reductase [Thermomonospora umbrina]
MDAQRLKDSFAHVARQGDAVALFFYSDLFVRNPQLRDMFPIGMSVQREKLLGALGGIVAQVDDLPSLVPFLQQLGRDHRKFGIVAEHYPAVGASLLATLKYFCGTAWNDDLAEDWNAAYTLVSKVMLEAANEDALRSPAWWNAQVIGVERRRFDIAMLRVVPDQPLPYLPGQSVAVETTSRPRHWRYYSMANAPRADHTIDFHVRLVDGGPVSSVLVRSLHVGDRLRLGAPVGTLTLNEDSPRDVLLVAGSTGLAPLKAILEQLARRPSPPRTHLFFGARTHEGLYDLEELSKLAMELRWLTLVPAVSDEPPGTLPGLHRAGTAQAEHGTLPDVVGRRGLWIDHDAYVCGPPVMVARTNERLVQLGVNRDRIRMETFAEAQR